MVIGSIIFIGVLGGGGGAERGGGGCREGVP